MVSLYERIRPYRSVSLAGMCKNAGKTTALNRMVAELHAAREIIALTSIGRDGESTDLVTGTGKPGIFVYAETLFATAENLMGACDVTKEILDTTGIHTPVGEVVAVRAKSDGFVQLAGPSMTAQLAPVADIFREAGAERILVDGAQERKSFSASHVTDAVVLCTGASYNKSMDIVVRDTVYAAELLMLKEAAQEEDIAVLTEQETLPDVFAKGGAQTVRVNGALTDRMVQLLLTSALDLNKKTIVVQDGTKVLLAHDNYRKLERRGMTLAVMNPVHLAAVTVNPFSAYGFHFDAGVFLDRMREAFAHTGIPVYDVLQEGVLK